MCNHMPCLCNMNKVFLAIFVLVQLSTIKNGNYGNQEQRRGEKS